MSLGRAPGSRAERTVEVEGRNVAVALAVDGDGLHDAPRVSVIGEAQAEAATSATDLGSIAARHRPIVVTGCH